MKVSEQPAVLLFTNDDGISAAGLRAMEGSVGPRVAAARGLDCVTVAPAFSQSGASRALTLSRPLRCDQVAPGRYQLDGSPADCVLYAVKHLLKGRRIAGVLSGINHGPNLGSDIAYSGTIAAALEAARAGIPALAISLAADGEKEFAYAAEFAAEAAERLLASALPPDVAVSVNVPPGAPKGARVTRPCRRRYSDSIEERVDPFGRSYYWMAGDATIGGEAEPGTDLEAVAHGYISITPLDSDFHAPYTDLSSWNSSAKLSTSKA